MKNLYFIAYFLSSEFEKTVTGLKTEIAEKFGVKHALKLAPHITLVPPFKMNAENEKGLIDHFEILKLPPPFLIEVDGFGHFDNRVIYLQVNKMDVLNDLKVKTVKHIEKFYKLQKDRHGFNPHITLAHRDMSPEAFTKIWSYLHSKKLTFRAPCDNIKLLKHTGRWQVLKELKTI